MKLIVEIDSEHVSERHINLDNGGFTVREQVGYLALEGERYPQKVNLQLTEKQPPYPQ